MKGREIYTHLSLDPIYTWCCKWYNHTVYDDYVLEKGYLYLDRQTKQIKSSLGNMHGCHYEDGICEISGYGTILWEPVQNKSCQYIEGDTKSGELWNENWL